MKRAMQLETARAAADLLAPMFAGQQAERLVVAYVDSEGRLLALSEPAGERTADAVGLPVREILTEALRAGAAGLLLAHNHPSGDPLPSAADVAATNRLAAAADLVGLRLHDHLIFAGGQCRSFRALGLL